MSKRLKAGIYARVSTDKQELDNQVHELKRFCKEKGYTVYWVYSDITSGKHGSRPQFNRLFEDAHKRLFHIVIFWDLSRFSRGGVAFTLKKLQELQLYGVNWISYQEPYLNSIGEFRDVIISLLSTIAKVEREKISERTKAGLERLKRKGKKLGRPKGSNDKKKRYRKYWKKPIGGD